MIVCIGVAPGRVDREPAMPSRRWIRLSVAPSSSPDKRRHAFVETTRRGSFAGLMSDSLFERLNPYEDVTRQFVG